MYLSASDYKRLQDLKKLGKKATEAEKKELEELLSRKKKDSGEKKGKYTPGNDWAWWNKYPELMKDAANMRSNFIPGTDVINANGSVTGIPGVVRFEMDDLYGWDGSTTDAINVASRDLYLKMFQKYRGITTYQAADVGIVIVATCEVIKTVAWLERVYGIINRYIRGNWNMPYVELQAMGISAVDADYIRTHMSDYRYSLNLLINKCQRLCMPKDMSVVSDKISLYGYEYLDHETTKAQIILFDPCMFGVFDEVSLTTGSSVKLARVTPIGANGLISVANNTIAFPFLELQLDALLGSDSVQKIYGDFLAWFGEGQLLTLLTMPDDYVVIPVYSKSIMHKIHNMDILTITTKAGVTANQSVRSGTAYVNSVDSADKATFKTEAAVGRRFIYQHDNIIETRFGYYTSSYDDYEPGSDGVRYPTGGNDAPWLMAFDVRLIDGYEADWSDEFVCEGVLWKSVYEIVKHSTSGDHFGFHLVSGAFEVCLNCTVYSRTSSGLIVYKNAYNYIADGQAGQLLGGLELQTIDWAPVVYIGVSTGAAPYNETTTIKYVLGDVECCRQVSSFDTKKIVIAASMSGLKSDITPNK